MQPLRTRDLGGCGLSASGDAKSGDRNLSVAITETQLILPRQPPR
jgi:hypothetical protein